MLDEPIVTKLRFLKGISSPSGTNLPHKKLQTLGYEDGEDPESLSHLALNPYRVVTDRQTDRQRDGQTEFP